MAFLRIIGDLHYGPDYNNHHLWYYRMLFGDRFPFTKADLHHPAIDNAKPVHDTLLWNILYDKIDGVIPTTQAHHTIQIGDLAFHCDMLDGIDPQQHRVLAGNHDNYNELHNYPHFLGDYGVYDIPTFGSIFYVRGAFSVDHASRLYGISWWPEEELSMEQGRECLKLYDQVRPKMVISHDCPVSVVPHVTRKGFLRRFGFTQDIPSTKTNMLLQAMTDIHRPRLHIFGHHHISFDREIDGTRYVCVDKLLYVELDPGFLRRL